MHMADALISPAVAGSMLAATAVVAGISIKKVKMEYEPKKIPVMGVMGAFVFATQMINFTIPGTGSSGHLCGGMLLSALLGPFAGFLTMIGVLLIQCLLFADGGLLAIGCNVWNMAFYGCFIGALCIWKPIMRKGASKAKITAASILGCILTLQMGAFSVVLETSASGISKLPFTTFIGVMQPIHLAIGLVEGLITAVVLCFIQEARPELLWATEVKDKKQPMAFGKVIGILVAATAVIGGGISLLASSFPDGLEWSLEKITGSTELSASGSIYEKMANFQSKTALLPDYSLSHVSEQLGTSVSGIVGSIVVFAVVIALCYGLRFFRKKVKVKDE